MKSLPRPLHQGAHWRPSLTIQVASQTFTLGASSHPGGAGGELSLSWALQLSVEWGLGD